MKRTSIVTQGGRQHALGAGVVLAAGAPAVFGPGSRRFGSCSGVFGQPAVLAGVAGGLRMAWPPHRAAGRRLACRAFMGALTGWIGDPPGPSWPLSGSYFATWLLVCK